MGNGDFCSSWWARRTELLILRRANPQYYFQPPFINSLICFLIWILIFLIWNWKGLHDFDINFWFSGLLIFCWITERSFMNLFMLAVEWKWRLEIWKWNGFGLPKITLPKYTWHSYYWWNVLGSYILYVWDISMSLHYCTLYISLAIRWE